MEFLRRGSLRGHVTLLCAAAIVMLPVTAMANKVFLHGEMCDPPSGQCCPGEAAFNAYWATFHVDASSHIGASMAVEKTENGRRLQKQFYDACMSRSKEGN